jgi:hypothetical protein
MGDNAVLRRLFSEALRGPSFVDAGAILWQVSRRTGAGAAHEFELISSHQWFDPLKNLESWTAKAWVDALVVEGE